MGMQLTSLKYVIANTVKQTTDTAAATRQPIMVRKEGQMEEASWEVRNKEVKTVREEIKYGFPFHSEERSA